jgi:K+-transporting ATPase KdpF subunit
MSILYALALALTIGLFLYLLCAMFKPEKFS